MIDMAARETHFVDHLAPIWWALPASSRGVFWADGEAIARADMLGIAYRAGRPADDSPWPLVVASWGDFRPVRHYHRPVVLCEHGSGQTYTGKRNPSYAGGRDRGQAALFVVPNEQAAAANRRMYRTIPNVVVGSARADELAAIPPPAGPATAAISFHWRCAVVPETNTAFDHYRDQLAVTADELAALGITLIGHGHPRILGSELAAVYDAAGIEVVADFVDVVRRAHVYACDNSSTLFEFAGAGRPVVVLNSPRYRRRIRHGLRFWDEAGIGVNVDRPDCLTGGIVAAFADPAEQQEARAASIGRVYPVRGRAAQTAADAILGFTAQAMAS